MKQMYKSKGENWGTEINPHIYRELSFGKSTNTTQQRKYSLFQQMVRETQDMHMQNVEADTFLKPYNKN